MKYFLILLSLFSGISGFSQSTEISRELLIGIWYMTDHEEGKDVFTKEKSIRPEFTFNEDQTVTFSHCTDMCGCLAVTYEGVWKLSNNKIRIQYRKKWEPFYGQGKREFEIIDISLDIVIYGLNSNELIVEDYWPEEF